MGRKKKSKSPKQQAASGESQALVLVSTQPAAGPSGSGKKRKRKKKVSAGGAAGQPVMTMYGPGSEPGAMKFDSVIYIGGPQSTGAPWNGGRHQVRPTLYAGPDRHVVSFDKWRAVKFTMTFTPFGGYQAPGVIFLGWLPDPEAPVPGNPGGFLRMKDSNFGPVSGPVTLVVIFEKREPKETDPTGNANTDANTQGCFVWAMQGVPTGTGGMLTARATWEFLDPE